ncbi:MAG: phospho-N-acetylmuramoyl-pentapeptide-transferase [Bacilli bacterium]|nr:phospho-N-acetylmuramoyl-pentapeptide-transferase [Bacilli bacterium]
MLILTKSVLAMMISFFASIVLGYFIIPFLKRKKIGQNISKHLEEKHSKKNGIPTMGGIIFIISTFITVLVLTLMGKIEITSNMIIVLLVFLGYAGIGFVDDYLSLKRKTNNGLTSIQKLLLQFIIAIVFFIIFINNGGQPVLEIYTLNIKVDMGILYGLFILFVLLGSSNAVNITDGLDGLAAGLSVIAFISIGIIAWGSTWVVGNDGLAILSFIITGAVLGFLFYNSYPAKVFMGDTGSLSLGATMASIAILTDHVLTLVVIAGVFVIETLVVIIQTVSIVYFKKKVFLMSPLHHHFEKLGWEEVDIVKLFWIVGLLLSMAGIAFGVWI